MKYHTTKIRSKHEINKIIQANGGINHFRSFWPWLPVSPGDFILKTCHAYRIDSDPMNFAWGTPDPLALILLSSHEFYVFNKSGSDFSTAKKVLDNFVKSCQNPIKTYIPPKKKGLVKLCLRYGFEPIGDNYYVKRQTA